MKIMLPQEVDVWYMLPWLRKQLAVILKQTYSLSQKDIALKLHVTEAAVSQYVHDKRAQETELPSDAGKILAVAAKRIYEGEDLRPVLIWLQTKPEILEIKCALHRRHDDSVDSTCDLCMQK